MRNTQKKLVMLKVNLYASVCQISPPWFENVWLLNTRLIYYQPSLEIKQDSSLGSGSDNLGSIDSASDDDDHDNRSEMESHDDYEQGYIDGYYDGQDNAYNDYSDHQDDYYD